MNTTRSLETDKPDSGFAAPKRRTPTKVYREKLRARLREALHAVATEQWLPLGIRSLIAEELTAMHKTLATDSPTVLERLGAKARELSITASSYGEPLRNSATYGQLRLIDLELTAQTESSAA